MHQYSTDSGERLWVPIRIGIGAVGVVYLIQLVLGLGDVTLPWWVGAPGILGTYWLLFEVFDRWLWPFRPVRLLAGVRVPDVRGLWEGTVQQTSGGGGQPRTASLEIKQRWSTMSLALSTRESTSMSSIAGLEVELAGNSMLVYEYLNEPRETAVETMQAHRGFARLRLGTVDGDVQELRGGYFTGRGRETYGDIQLTRSD